MKFLKLWSVMSIILGVLLIVIGIANNILNPLVHSKNYSIAKGEITDVNFKGSMNTKYSFVTPDGTKIHSVVVIANPKFKVGDKVNIRYLNNDYYINIIDSIWFYGVFCIFDLFVGFIFLLVGGISYWIFTRKWKI